MGTKKSSNATRRPSRVRPVSIKFMRVPPALVTQRQFRQAHGDKLAAELDLNKLGFPVINHREGIFWVLDGQHRLYALKQNGFENDVLDCEVYEDLTDAEMADIFLGRDDRRAISVFDKFHVACTAGRVAESAIRRVVEANGLKIGKQREENMIGSVGALQDLYETSGDTVLGQTVRTLKRGFEGDPNAFDRALIKGIGLMYNRYNGKCNEKALTTRLTESPSGVRGVIRRAESQHQRTGSPKAQCVAAVCVEIYNKGLGPRAGDRLPSWWKESGDLS